MRRIDSFSRSQASGPVDLNRLVQKPTRRRAATPNPATTPRRTRATTQEKPAPRARRPKHLLFYAVTVPAVLVVGVCLTAAVLFVRSEPKTKLNAVNIVASVAKAATGYQAPIAGQQSGRTNILVYGMTLDGMRTDSIMLLSYYWKQKKLVSVNIPRDLYVYDGYENAKFGEVYSYAKQRQPHNVDYPAETTANLVEKEYGITVNYWFTLNMTGEIQLINTIGGINLDVPLSFTDCEYPTWNYSGYVRPCPSFTAGAQHMDGATALEYSRSRHSLDNGQGTDFARSQRQGQVLRSVMTSVKSMGIIGNLADLTKYLDILGNNVNTNMSTDEMVSFAQTVKGLSPTGDYIEGNWATGDGFLCSSTSSYGAYITLYGVPGDCGVQVNDGTDSKYRELAIYYVDNLLTSASQTDSQFLATALPSLPAPFGSGPAVAGDETGPSPSPAP